MHKRTVKQLEGKLAEATSPEERQELLLELAASSIGKELDMALKFAREALALADSRGDDRASASALLTIAHYHRCRTESGRAWEIVEHVGGMLADDPAWLSVRGLYYRTRGILMAARGERAAALSLFEDAIAIFRSLGDTNGTAGTLLALGRLHATIGSAGRGMESIVEAIRLARDTGDEEVQLYAYGALTGICYPIGDLDGALRYGTECVNRARRLGYQAMEVDALFHLGRIYRELGEIDLSIEFQNLTVSLAREVGLRDHVFAGLLDIAVTYRRQGRHDESLGLLTEALRESRELGIRSGEMNVLLSIGECHRDRGEYALAEPYLCASWTIARELRDYIIQIHTCRMLHEVYESTGDLRRALVFHKLRARYEQMVQRNAVQRALATIELDEATRKAAREREEQDRAVSEMREEMEKRKESLRRLELRLARKSELIAKLECEMRPLAGKQGGDASDLARNLLDRMRDGEDDTDWWSVFESRFRELHPGFVASLLERCPALTPAEVRVCALMKLSLSTKEMGELLRSSTRTVENHRRHIRQKLALGREVNLVTLLASMG